MSKAVSNMASAARGAAGKVGTAMHGTPIGTAMDQAVDKIEPNIPQGLKQQLTREAIAGIIVAAFAFWRRHQSRPRAVSDDTQMAKAL